MEETKTIGNWQRFKSVYMFLISLVASLILTMLLKEPGFNDSQVYVLFLMFFAIGLWFTEAVPAFSVSIFIIAYLVFMLGNKNLNAAPENIDKYVTTFSSSVVWLMLGGFFMAAAMSKTRLDEALFSLTVKISGTNPKKLLIGLMTTTMIASLVMSNTAATAMMVASIMPLLNVMGKQSGVAKALLLGVPIAATTGGMGCVIGTPPNLISVGALENAGLQVSFLDWIIYGLPLAVVLTAISCVVLISVFLKDNTPISVDFLRKKDEAPKTLEEKTQRTVVFVVIIVTVLLWLTTPLHGIKVGAVSAVPLVIFTLTGILKGKDVSGLPWDTLLLVAGGLSLGMALQNSGLLEHYAQQLRNMEVHYIILLLLLAYITMALSNIMSHTATSTILIPLGMAILPDFKIQTAVIIGLASSCALFLPVSTPPNAIVYSTGFMKISDFKYGGIVLGVLGPLITVLWLLFTVRS